MVSWISLSLVISAAAVSHAALASTVIASRTCSGPFEFLPALPFGFSVEVPMIDRAITAIYTKLKDRAQCQCHSLTDEGFNVLFDPISGLLNAASGGPVTPGCDGYFPRNLTAYSRIFSGELPSTCTYANWKSNGNCAFKLNIPFPSSESPVTLNVAISKCSTSRIPAIVVKCEQCDKFLMPCNNDGECLGTAGSCAASQTNRADFVKNIFETFSGGGEYMVHGKRPGLFWGSNERSPGCMQKETGATSSNDVVTSLLTWFRNEVYGVSGEVSELKFCGADAIFSNTSDSSNNGNNFEKRSPTQFMVTVNASDNTEPAEYFAAEQSCFLDHLNINLNNASLWTQGAAVINGLLPVLPPPDLVSTDTSTYRLGEISCDGQLSLLGGAMRVRMGRKFMDALDEISTAIRRIQDCRAGKSLSTAQFLTRFASWTLYPWMWALDGHTNVDSFDLGPSMADFVSGKFARTGSHTYLNNTNYDNRARANIIQSFPSTCSFMSMVQNGKCSLKYVGFQSLLHMDTNLQFQAAPCPAHEHFQSAAIDCIGTDCARLKQMPTPCSSSSDCPGQMDCFDFKKSGSWVSDTDGFWDLLFPNPTGGETNATICNHESTGYVTDNICGGGLINEQAIAYTYFRAAGVAEDTATSAQLKVCVPSINFTDSNELATWAQSQISIDANGGVLLSNMLPFSTESEEQNSDETAGATVTPNNIVLWLPFIIAIVALQVLGQ